MAQTGPFVDIKPLGAVVVEFAVLGEAITPVSLLRGSVMVFGVWLLNRSRQSLRVVEETTQIKS